MARRKSGRPAYVLQDISAPNIIKDLLLLCGATFVMLTIISVLLLTNVADLLATWELSKSRIAFRPEAHCKRALFHMFCGLLLFEAVLLYIILLHPLRTDNKTAMGFLDCFGGKVAKSCARKGKKKRQKEKGKSVLKIASQAMRGEDGLMEVVSKLKVYEWTMGWFNGSDALPQVENVTEENKKKKTKGKKNRRKGQGQTSEARGGAVPMSKDHHESGSPGGEETPGHSHSDKDCVKEPASPLKSSSSGTWSTDSQDNGGFTTVTYKGAWGKTKKSSPLPNDGLHPGSHAVSEVSHTHD